MNREQKLAKRFALLIGILLAAISYNKSWTWRRTGATWAVDGIRVQLRLKALHNGSNVGHLIKCVSRHLNGTYARLSPQDEDLNQVDGSDWVSCQVDLLENSMSPFVGLIRIGEPEQEFEMLFDTGSDVLWVAHKECKTSGLPLTEAKQVARNYVNLFVPEKSRTFRQVSPFEELSITYLNGFTFSGPLGRDVMQFGRKRGRSSPMFVPDQEFAIMTSIDHMGKEQYDCPFDGIIGLRAPINSSKANLLESLMRHKLIEEPLFVVDIRQTGPKPINLLMSAPSGRVAGELVFGSIDHARYVGQLIWAPLNQFPKWQIRVERIEVLERLSGRILAEACAFGCDAVVDTGTNFVLGPKQQVESINRALGFEHLGRSSKVWWSPDCLKSERARKVALVYHMAGRKFVFNDYAVIFDDHRAQERTCISMLWPLQEPGQQGEAEEDLGYWILGAPFIEKFYTVFDYGRRRIGFGLKAD